MLFKKQVSAAKELFCWLKHLSVVLVVLFSLFSCTDQGCIEADDFGEYDTQTLEVRANNTADNCTFDVSKPLTDASQGSGLKTCLALATDVKVCDANDICQESQSGCAGLAGPSYRSLCTSNCIAECISNVGAGDPGISEPAWISTSEKNGGQNGGVTISPNSLVYIRAVGSVRLGDKLPFPDFFVSTDTFMPQSKRADWTNQNLDLKVGKAINLSFSGKIDNDGSLMNGGANKVGRVGAGASSTFDHAVYNAGRRLIAYMIPGPSGYSTDNSKPVENEQYLNIPLLPDVNLWQCNYAGASFKQAACSNKSYKDNGYPNVNDALVASTFPVTSDAQSTVLGQYGGMVRWAGDNIEPDSFDPFAIANVVCGANCSNVGAVDPLKGAMVGNFSSSDITIIPPVASKVSFKPPVASKVSFKVLLNPANRSCDDTIDVTVTDSGGAVLYYFTNAGGMGGQPIEVTSSRWSATHVPVEIGQKIIIKKKAVRSYSFNGNAVSCDRAIAVRFGKYQDIAINQSGFVSFALLGGSAGGATSCSIKARIINPSGKHTASTVAADFYEYANFNAAGDPMSNLAVPMLARNLLWQNAGISNGSKQVFVRKGQIIRFSPETWNGTWSTDGGARECGVGMAMRIEPRPALLCRGYGNTEVLNPLCRTLKLDSSNGALIGCDEVEQECSNISSTSAYCPNAECVAAINCTNGVFGGVPTRYDCTKASTPKCVIPASSGYTAASCNACNALRLANAQLPPKVSMPNIALCYDLESYRGRVSNIPVSGFSTEDLAKPDIAKGATLITSFNGNYGNFSGFGISGKVDGVNKNIIYQVAQPIIISKNGRLKFLFLDGTDFVNEAAGYADNNPTSSSPYNGVNGFKVNLASALEFSNGEWLEAKLCEQLGDSGEELLSCKKVTLPAGAFTNLAGQPKIVELDGPSGTSLSPVSNAPFYFDVAGNLIRSKSPVASDCVGVQSGDTYYCHNNTTVDVSRIRLTFKIKDPEAANCDTAKPTVSNPENPNGIIITNPRFVVSDCVVGGGAGERNGITNSGSACVANPNAGKTCVAADDAVAGGCTKEFRCVNKYANNSGKYYVTVRVKTPGSGTISNIVGDVISPVVEAMDGTKDGTKIGQAERIYKLIISDPKYQAILSISLVVMFTFYGFGYLIGVTEAGASDIISKLVKISVIYLFVGPEGWTWFNDIVVKFFKDGTDYLAFLMASSFDNSTTLQNAIQNSDFYDKSILFSSVDKVFGIFFSSTVQKKISALLFASIFGWAYLLIIYYGLLLYVYAVANAVLLYLTSQVFISILFVLGPLFFVFTLFAQTKEMFDKWLSQLISFSLQQIFLLTTLAFFNMMMYEVIKMVLGYKICWDEVWTINIITRITLMSFWTISSLPPRVNAQSDVGNIGNPDGIPSFFTILFIWVIADLMLKFVTFMTDMAASISGGLKASSLGAGVKAAAQGMQKFAGARVSEIWDKTGGEAVRKLDKSLFDSGAKADQERAAKKQENAKNFAHKGAMADAGSKAVSDYKRKNGADLVTMSKEDQEKLLTKVKNEAMTAEGIKRGLSKEDAEKIQKDKGFKYVGENVLGAAYQAAKQGLTKGGSLRTSLSEQKTDLSFSGKEAKEAFKNTDSKGRADFLDAIKKDNVRVEKSGWEGLKKSVKTLGGTTTKLKQAAIDVGKFVHDKDYDEARDQLVDEGVIPKMAAGTYVSLPKEAKDKIRKRAAANIKQRDIKKKSSSDNTIAKMEQFAQSYDEKEDSDSGEYARSEGLGSALLGREKTFAMALERRKKAGKKAKEENVAMRKEGLEEKKLETQEKFDEAEEDVTRCDGIIDEIQGDSEFQRKTAEFEDLRGVAVSKNTTSQQKSDARKKLAALQSDPVFKKQNQDLKSITAQRRESANKAANYQISINNTDKEINAINWAQERNNPLPQDPDESPL